jgi:hypothetical protein
VGLGKAQGSVFAVKPDLKRTFFRRKKSPASLLVANDKKTVFLVFLSLATSFAMPKLNKHK